MRKAQRRHSDTADVSRAEPCRDEFKLGAKVSCVGRRTDHSVVTAKRIHSDNERRDQKQKAPPKQTLLGSNDDLMKPQSVTHPEHNRSKIET